MSELELCPTCKKGSLRPTGDVSIAREPKPNFRQTGSTRELICDYCGQRRINAGFNEYV